VGIDFPEKHIAFLKGKGVGIASLRVDEGETFRWAGEYEGAMNAARTLRTDLGVLAGFDPSVAPAERDIRHLFLANVDPDLQIRLVKKMRSPQLIGLDSMNFWINSKRASLLSALKMAHIFVANDQEARDLSGETNLIKAAKSLAALGPKMVLIKKGEHGVFFYSRFCVAALPAYPTEAVVDPTGAGDTFAGGFMGSLSRARRVDERAIKRALAFGTVAASYNVEAFGVEKTEGLTMKGIAHRLSRYKKLCAI